MLMEKIINVVTTEGSMLLRGIRSDMRMKIYTERAKKCEMKSDFASSCCPIRGGLHGFYQKIC